MIRLKFLLLYGFVWTLFFQLYRLLFTGYINQLPPELIAASAWHGLLMDVATTGYLLLIPTLLMMFTFRHWKWYQQFMTGYTLFTTLVIGLITVADLELYRSWGFRLDSTPLFYLTTPAEAFASATGKLLLLLFFLLASTVLGSNFFLQRVVARSIPFFTRTSGVFTTLLFLLCTAFLIIPIRGGIQLAPMNQSTVYFSGTPLANHAAINVSWNFFNSLTRLSKNRDNPYVTMEAAQADSLVHRLYTTSGQPGEKVLTDSIPRPNVLLIIWESFTAKSVGALHGLEGVTPEFAALIPEGLFFTQLYASGDRSDKGMIAILSGYPSQPVTSIIKSPAKSRSLPSLSGAFREAGYTTSFYYGGESEFANMKSYFTQQNFQYLIDKNAFDSHDMNSKWGAHDHVVFNRVLSDLDTVSGPFFSAVFTLSSHEPFEVPVPAAIPGNDEQSRFLNALHYTDHSLGAFIRACKEKTWWKNTLVIILADHGHRLPVLSPNTKPDDYHVPMLWLGGALAKTGTVDTLGSQTDLAASLLNQLHFGQAADRFAWSNDLFRPGRIPFAYFAFNNGIGWIRPAGYLIQENVSKKIIEKGVPDLSEEEIRNARAYLQSSFSDYLKR